MRIIITMNFAKSKEIRWSRLEESARRNRFRFILNNSRAWFKIVDDAREGKLDKESVLRFLKIKKRLIE